MSYTVYKHTSPSGKVYIGLTGRRPERRFHGGSAYRNNPYFFNAIKKYGWGAFNHDIIATGLTKDEACALEIQLIEEYRSTDHEFGYNRSRGGDKTTLGYTHSDETKAKIAEKARGRPCPHSPEWNRKISLSNKGHVTSDETKAKLRTALGGRFNTPEARGRQRANTPKGASHPKATAVVCLETDRTYNTITEAAKETGTSRQAIGKVIHGEQKTAAGFHWRVAIPEELHETER